MTSRVPSWDSFSPSCLLPRGSWMWYDRHRFSRARMAPPTGGRQRSTCNRRTLHPWTRGRWCHPRPVRPLQPAVRRHRLSGPPWAPWATRRFNCRRRRPPSANRTTAQARTRQARTTAHPQLLPRYLLCLCRASWPSSAGQAPRNTALAALDGTRGLHHSTPLSPKWITICSLVPTLSNRSWEPRTIWPVRLWPPLARRFLHAALRRPTRNQCDLNDMMCNPTSYHDRAWDGVSRCYRFSPRFLALLSPTFFPPIYLPCHLLLASVLF